MTENGRACAERRHLALWRDRGCGEQADPCPPVTASCRAGKTGFDPVTIKMLAAYVHSRGGGQQAAPAQDEVAEETEVAQSRKGGE